MAIIDVIATAFATGIGAGIGSPIGNWFYKNYFEHRLDKAHNNIKNATTKVSNGEIDVPVIDTEEKIRQLLGKN